MVVDQVDQLVEVLDLLCVLLLEQIILVEEAAAVVEVKLTQVLPLEVMVKMVDLV